MFLIQFEDRYDPDYIDITADGTADLDDFFQQPKFEGYGKLIKETDWPETSFSNYEEMERMLQRHLQDRNLQRIHPNTGTLTVGARGVDSTSKAKIKRGKLSQKMQLVI